MIKNLKTKKENQEKKTKGIIITTRAKNQIFNLLQESKEFIGIRIKIKKSGCAGFRYYLEKIKTKNKEEFIFYYENFIICIPFHQIDLLKNIKIDFITEGINQVFKFYNSRIKKFCGCGESFELIK